MIEILITVGLVLLVIGIICQCTDTNDWAFFLGVVGAYILSGGMMMYQESCKPLAMDVYKGKTTLQITYKDSIPVDSVVVFKDNENYDKR